MSIAGRRSFCKSLVAGLATAGLARPLLANAPMLSDPAPRLNTRLYLKARAAFDAHAGQITQRDLMAVADFSAPSRLPRFHIVNLLNGEVQSLLVAHGKGSDPEHSGFVRQFSNIPGSEATSAGAYLLSDRYTGQHGASRRLIGLDPQNDQAEPRAIVIHSAWYVSESVAAEQGKIGRSQGCFAFSGGDIGQVLERLGAGTLLYADKL
jgi:L,D-transpeptidase catalytic domain